MEPETPTAQPTVVEAIQTALLARGSARGRHVDWAWMGETHWETAKMARAMRRKRRVWNLCMG